MKKIFLTIFLLLIGQLSIAQTIPSYTKPAEVKPKSTASKPVPIKTKPKTVSIDNESNMSIANVRAQGNYYSAKSNFESNNYDETLNYISKCKITLGGTNRELQYLQILAAYRSYKYEIAAKELQSYIDIQAKKIKIINFDKSVDRLSDDQTKELTMLIDPIFEAAIQVKDNPCSGCEGSGIMKKNVDCDNCKGDGFLKKVCNNNIGNSVCNKGKKACRCRTCGVSACEDGCNFGRHGCSSGSAWTGDYREWTVKCKNCNNSYVDCDECKGLGYLKKNCYNCNNTGKTKSPSEEITCDKCRGRRI